jgi:hypothetical protein
LKGSIGIDAQEGKSRDSIISRDEKLVIVTKEEISQIKRVS